MTRSTTPTCSSPGGGCCPGPWTSRRCAWSATICAPAVVVIGDGVRPSNTGRGYVPRRLVRRLLTTLRREDPSRTLSDLPVELLQHTLDHFRQTCGTGPVRDVLLEEERGFDRLLERGRRLLSGPRYRGPLSEEDYDYLHDTHGLPRDLVLGLRPQE